MQEQAPVRIWSLRRQWLGNLVPFAVALVVSLLLFKLGLVIQVGVGIIVAILGVSQWGFFENAKIEQELRAKTGGTGELIGFVFRKDPTMLDAHAEIGFLKIEKLGLEIVTEDESFEINRSEVTGVARQNNIHSILRLGGWVVLHLADQPDFKFESRGFRTMWRSTKRSKELFDQLKDWINEKAPA